MATATFEFDAFADEFTLTLDADGESWPLMEVTIDYIFHPPEPDVGIFHEQIDVQKVTHFFGEQEFDDEDAFSAAVYEAIAGDIEEDAVAVATKIREQIAVWECDCDEADGEDDSDRD